MSSAAISVQGLAYRYGNRQAIDDLSFTVARGEIFGLLGPNGGGKTTLFRLLSTLLSIQSGQLTVLETDVATAPWQVRQRIGVTFQSPALDGRLTVSENLRHQGHLYGLSGSRLARRMHELLEQLQITDRSRDRVDSLSGGLRRRVEIAKGLLHHPQVLLLDEPSTGLDPSSRRELWNYLQELRDNSGMTILVTTHLMEVADRCDRLGILDQGRLVASGTPRELRDSVGGDCLTISSDTPEPLIEKIRDRFSVEANMLDDAIRIEQADGHELLREIVAAFPEDVTAISLGRPTLEDVFVARTGHRFEVSQ